jgi:serine/threonine protein kinase
MLVPSTSLTLEREKELAANPSGVFRLKESLEEVQSKYDFVLIDCPPSLGVLTHAALFASQIVLLTIETSFLALHGVGQLLRLIQNLETQRPSPLQVFALATLFDRRTNFAKAVLKDMRNYFQDRLLNTVIRQSSPLREASSFGKPITVYSRTSRGCEDYLSLAEEILERLLSVEPSEKRWTMDEIALFSHLYGEGKKTDQVLRALGLTSLDNLKSLTAKRLSKQGRIPVRAAKRLISKAEKLGELPLVVHGQTILLETPISEEALPTDLSGKSSEVTPEEVTALAQNLAGSIHTEDT